MVLSIKKNGSFNRMGIICFQFDTIQYLPTNMHYLHWDILMI